MIYDHPPPTALRLDDLAVPLTCDLVYSAVQHISRSLGPGAAPSHVNTLTALRVDDLAVLFTHDLVYSGIHHISRSLEPRATPLPCEHSDGHETR